VLDPEHRNFVRRGSNCFLDEFGPQMSQQVRTVPTPIVRFELGRFCRQETTVGHPPILRLAVKPLKQWRASQSKGHAEDNASDNDSPSYHRYRQVGITFINPELDEQTPINPIAHPCGKRNQACLVQHHFKLLRLGIGYVQENKDSP